MDSFRVRALHRLLDTQALGADDFDAARHMLLRKLEILLTGARKHANHQLIDEFEPLHQRWRASAEAAAC
jgi:hypothetical protein